MGDAANKESASEFQVPEQSAEGWQEAGKSSPSCCCGMAEGRGDSLGLLFHSLTKRETIAVTAEAWFLSERGNIYTCHAMGQLLSLFAAAQNWNNSHRLHGSLSDFESGIEAVPPCQETGGKERICVGENLSPQHRDGALN